jgi:hypothetical protein
MHLQNWSFLILLWTYFAILISKWWSTLLGFQLRALFSCLQICYHLVYLNSCYHFVHFKSVLFLQGPSIAGAPIHVEELYRTLNSCYHFMFSCCVLCFDQVDIFVDTNTQMIAGLPELQFVNQGIKYMGPLYYRPSSPHIWMQEISCCRCFFVLETLQGVVQFLTVCMHANH